MPGAARAVGAQTPSLPAAGEGAAGQGGADADQTPLPELHLLERIKEA